MQMCSWILTTESAEQGLYALGRQSQGEQNVWVLKKKMTTQSKVFQQGNKDFLLKKGV